MEELLLEESYRPRLLALAAKPGRLTPDVVVALRSYSGSMAPFGGHDESVTP